MDTRTRGLRMKINSTGTPPLAPLPAATPAAVASGPAPTPDSGGSTPQSALLQTARAQLQEMPQIDQARVAEVRAALERGEIAFDAAKLAGLITRYHGSRG